MTPDQAAVALRGRPVVPVMYATIHAVKEMHAEALSHGIPAAMRRRCTDSGG